VGFVNPATRPGVLPRMLSEILDTRVMVKGAMKRLTPADRVRVPPAQQGRECIWVQARPRAPRGALFLSDTHQEVLLPCTNLCDLP